MKTRLIRYAKLLMLFPLLASGCATNLGYHMEHAVKTREQLTKAYPPHEVQAQVVQTPSVDRCILVVKALGSLEQEWDVVEIRQDLKVEKRMPYSLIGKGIEILELPVMCVIGLPLGVGMWMDSGNARTLSAFPPADLVMKLFGGHGFHGQGIYDKEPPSYGVRLSHNLMTGLINPLQVCLFGDAQFRTNLFHEISSVVGMRRKTVSGGLKGCAVAVETRLLPSLKLNGVASSDGLVSLDLTPWQERVPPHEDLDIRITGTFGNLWCEKNVAMKTDDILTPRMIALREKAPGPRPQPVEIEPKDVFMSAVTNIAPNLKTRRQIALVIGIDSYTTYPVLKTAVADARAVAQVLKGNYGFSEVSTVLDGQATRAGMLEAFRKTVAGIKGGEDVLIYFAGHGIYSDTMDRGYWVPQDAMKESDFLPNSEVVDCIRAMDKKGVAHVMVIADSCFSGTLVGQRGERGMRLAKSTAAEAVGWLGRVVARPSRRALTSGAADQSVPDGSRSSGHSVFAGSLLTVLRSPDYPLFSGTELAVQVRRIVGANSDQAPQLGVIQNTGDKDGEFVFVHKK